MTDLFASYFAGVTGYVHAGSGPLNVFEAPRTRGFRPRRQPADELSWLFERYVYPPAFGNARAKLEEHWTVFLDAPPGSGRNTAAKILLWEMRTPGCRFHELTTEDREEANGFRIDSLSIAADDRVWLDLADADAPLWAEIQGELSELRETVREHKARLVVVMPYRQELPPQLHQYRIGIDRPALPEVLRLHLKKERIPGWENLPEPTVLKDAQSLLAVRRYVEYIVDARDREPGASLTHWLDSANERFSGQEKAVAELVGKLETGAQRALLLATAMLHGAHADVIDSAADALVSAARSDTGEAAPVTAAPLEGVVPLEGVTLHHRLVEIDANRDATGSVRFARPGYESAVREFFWNYFPDLHTAIARWTRKTVSSSGLSDDERASLVIGLTELCLPRRYQSVWKELVEQLTAGPATPARMAAAYAILQHGLRDKRSGQIFRRQILDWSRSDGTADRLAAVLVAACRDEMAISHPEQALVRLHHLARHKRPDGAREALLRLAGNDFPLQCLLLYRLTVMSSQPERPADAELFIDLADPRPFTARWLAERPLIAPDPIKDQLTAGWQLAFTCLASEDWTQRAADWLQHAAGDDANRDMLLDMLVAATGCRFDLSSVLYGMACRLGLGEAVGDPLLSKIALAQGVELP